MRGDGKRWKTCIKSWCVEFNCTFVIAAGQDILVANETVFRDFCEESGPKLLGLEFSVRLIVGRVVSDDH